jgi:PCI domain-containing protein
MKLFIKDSILKFFGYTLFFMGVIILFVGIGMFFDPDGTNVIWRGSYIESPVNPKENYAYYDINKKKAYLWKDNKWIILDDKGDDTSDAIPIAIVSNIFFIPGILLILLGKKAARKEDLLKSATGIIKSYRRITLYDLSEKLSISVAETENVLAEIVNLKLIKGNFDRTTSEFFTDDAEIKSIKHKFCSSCGSSFDRIYLQGETVKCEKCGIIMG